MAETISKTREKRVYLSYIDPFNYEYVLVGWCSAQMQIVVSKACGVFLSGPCRVEPFGEDEFPVVRKVPHGSLS